jgi:gentisate 1,2-dioxygenase
MMAVDIGTADLEQFQNSVIEENLFPLWMQTGIGGPRSEPRPRSVPYLWRWQHVRQRMFQASELIPVGREGAERRVLQLQNPGLKLPAIGTTETLVAAVQFIHGNEVAPSHRHSMSALRFIKEGKGACTIVNGGPESMEVGDLVLTPGWYWHGHFSEHAKPMIWMDGLDVPLVWSLAANFGEEYPETLQTATENRDESMARYGAGTLMPVGDRPANPNSPLLRYRWDVTEERLTKLADRDGSPYDGLALEYTNPYTGGPVMPTIDCWIQMLRPGEKTQAHRHTGAVIYNVARGSGSTVINGQRFDWTAGDMFCVPSWAIHEHANASDSDDAILFSMNDSPVLRALNLYREATYDENGGHQAVTSTFQAVQIRGPSPEPPRQGGTEQDTVFPASASEGDDALTPTLSQRES